MYGIIQGESGQWAITDDGKVIGEFDGATDMARFLAVLLEDSQKIVKLADFIRELKAEADASIALIKAPERSIAGMDILAASKVLSKVLVYMNDQGFLANEGKE